MNFNIKNNEKHNDISKDSIIIEEIEDKEEIDIKKAFEEINKEINLNEVKILKDILNIYLISKKGYIHINNNDKINSVKFEKEISELRQVIPKFNSIDEIDTFEIYDNDGKIDDINVNNNLNTNIEKIISSEVNLIDIDKIDVNTLSENEITLLSKMLDFQRVNINLTNNPNDIKGLIKSETNNPNEYNKIYFDNCTNKKTLHLSNEQFILLSNIDILMTKQ